MNIHRRKEPAVLRAQIMKAAETTLAEKGVASFTFDRVLHKAEVSKGGLQHHFPTKRALLDALFEQYLSEFQLRIKAALKDEPEGPARNTRAYLRASCVSATTMASGPRAAILLLLETPEYQRTWAEYVDEICSTDTIDEDLLLTCRYAADGLWFGHVMQGCSKPAHVEAVLTFLLRLTHASTT